MSDLISRQDAIELAIQYCPDDDGTCSKADEDIRNLLDELEDLPSAQPEQRWIPCSERLPEEKDSGILKKLGIEKKSKDVLATVEVKGERMTATAWTHDGTWDWKMKHAFPDYKIIAWMPMPEPYKGGEDHETD